MDLDKMVFLSDVEGYSPDSFVFPVYNATEHIRHPYKLVLPGLLILSMEADGKPIVPEPCAIDFDDPLDMSTMQLKPGGCFAYIKGQDDDNVLLFMKTVSKEDLEHELVEYTLPPTYSILKIRYAVRDGVSNDTFYEGTVTFADRLPENTGKE